MSNRILGRIRILTGIAVVAAACTAMPKEPPEIVSPSAVSPAPGAPAGQPPGTITWAVETDPLPDGRDAADDPAIWVDPDDGARSVIIGTNKKGGDGLVVYDLGGSELESTGGAAMNNVDLRPRVLVDGQERVLVVASTIQERTLELFTLDPQTRQLSGAGASLETGIRASGVCLFQPADDLVYAFATGGNGHVQQWQLTAGSGDFDGEMVRELEFGSQLEGCVVDDATGTLYLSEETRGIWRISADPAAVDDRELLDTIGGAGGLEADIEGLAIAAYDEEQRFLVASSQGNDRFVVYRLNGAQLPDVVGDLTIAGPDDTDGVTHTDGVDLTLLAVGPAPFDRGVLVVQDDDNEEPEGGEANQNFKVISWAAVEDLLGMP